mgnify:CR=1 FL=1
MNSTCPSRSRLRSTGWGSLTFTIISDRENTSSAVSTIRAPAAIAGYIAKKGSVTVNGVSLTVNRVEGRDFWINLIPHTLENTTLNRLKPGSKVNLEVDLIARYCERLLTAEQELSA